MPKKVIKSVKTIKKTKDNVVKLPKPKQIKQLNLSLSRGSDGNYIKDLNWYYNINPERFVTTDDSAILLPGLISKSTLEKNRSDNKDDAGERGPQSRTFTERVVKYKILWLMRFREGLPWIKEEPELKHHYTVTAINIPLQQASSFKKTS